MDIAFQLQLIQPIGLFLSHNPDVNSVQLDGLIHFEKIVNGIFPIRIGEEVIVKHLNPFSVRVKFYWLYRMEVTHFIPYQAERTFADATSAEKLKTELAVWVDAVVHCCA